MTPAEPPEPSASAAARAGDAAPGAPAGAVRRFRFVAPARPLLSGGALGLAVMAATLSWAYLTGRLRQVDGPFAAVVLGSVVLSTAVVLGRLRRAARSAAAALGHLELDERGLRWQRGDGTLGLQVAWTEVASVTVDARNATAVMLLRDGRPVLLGVLSESGVPSGFVALERFGELARLLGRRVPTAPHKGVPARVAGTRALLLGAACCLLALGLYAANRELAARLHFRRLLLPMPLFLGVTGLLTLGAGARLRAGRGPLVSPMYGPGFLGSMLRFLVVAVLANFSLVWLFNRLWR